VLANRRLPESGVSNRSHQAWGRQGARGRGRLTADLESQSLEVYNFAPRRARADLNADLESLSK